MNKKLFLLVMFVLSLGLGFTACGDDDEDDPAVDYAAQIAGTYNGNLVVNLGAGDQPGTSQDIVVGKKEANTVELSLKNFSFDVLEVGDIKIETTVSESNGVIKLADKKTSMSLATGVLTADVELSSATVKDNKLTLNIKVTNIKQGGVALPLIDIVTVDFSGNKK